MASLAEEVAAELERLGIPFCVIGAIALAAHGVPRGTNDVDLLVCDPRVLAETTWAQLSSRAAIELRRGDAEDPLLGVARFLAPGEPDVDVIVGRGAWEREVIERAVTLRVGSRTLPVADAADLVLLKLFAGGPQDAWDIQQLLSSVDAPVLKQVDSRVLVLPADARELWARVRAASSSTS